MIGAAVLVGVILVGTMSHPPSVPLQDEVLDFDEDFQAAVAPAPKNQKGPKTTDGLRWTQI